MAKKQNIAESIWRAFASANIKIAEILTTVPEQDPISEGLGRLGVSDMTNQTVLDYWLEDRLRNINKDYRGCELSDMERLVQVIRAVEDYFEQQADNEEEETIQELNKDGFSRAEIEMAYSM